MEAVFTTNAPKPGGHYSQAMVHGDLIFVAGQLPFDAAGNKLNGPIEEQTLQTLKNLRAVLEAAGSDTNHVLKTTVFVADISLWSKVNQVYSEFFGEHKPARAIVPTKELNHGFLIEIEAIATKK
ncbi:MAG TPA: Rid family detoxifying hydrolase [Chitinophagaceae bacterium]|nr:Rid family detoxifying hydrolase [Chitinophagaceae bacterium]